MTILAHAPGNPVRFLVVRRSARVIRTVDTEEASLNWTPQNLHPYLVPIQP